jgi:VWFA-related protein
VNGTPWVWILTGVIGLLTSIPGSQVPQFRASTTGVSHHVIVQRDGRGVQDLRAEDFLLTDTGITQQITVVDAAGVPLDISLVSEGVRYVTSTTFDREMAEVANQARPEDRVRVVLIDDDQREQRVGSAYALLEAAARRRTCVPVYDALARVLMRPTDPGRQHVIVLLTVSEGSGSVLSSAQVMEVAKRSNARVYALISLDAFGATGSRPWVSDVKCARLDRDLSADGKARLRQLESISSSSEQVRELWLDSKNRLVQIAKVTGGAELRPAVLTRSITGPVREALEDARSGYILRYTATNVPETGWHPITVKINRPGNYQVQVRPGYQR